jgi:putative lipoprotein
MKEIVKTMIVLLAAVLLLSACGETGSQETSTVSGDVVTTGQATLPVSAVMEVYLVDWAKTDTQADSSLHSTTIGSFRQPLQGQQLPQAFEIVYNPADIAFDHLYTVQATISTPEDGVLFVTTELYPVITQNSPTSGLEVAVQSVTPVPPTSVSGTVNKRDRSALPPDALVEVSLLETTQQEAAPILNQQVIPLNGQQLPVEFNLSYDMAAIDPAGLYSVQARVLQADGKLLYISQEDFPVITQDHAVAGVEVWVEQVTEPTATFTATSEPTATELPPTATQAPPPTSPPDDPALVLGTPTFKDSFSKNSGNWTLFDYDCFQSEIIDGKYVMTGKGAGYMCWEFTWPKVKNFYLETTVQPVDECPEGNAYGLIFRSPDNNAGYVYALSCEGQYYLWAWDGENGTTLLKPTNSTQILPGANQENRIGVKADGKTLDLYINGVLQTRVTDEQFLERGKFGTAILALDGQPFTVYFDNLTMWELP